jgi:hypothetical protein
MRPTKSRLAFLALPSAILLVVALVGSASAGGRPLTGTMSGAAERPTPGDADGTGTFAFWLNAGQGEICYELTAAGILPAAAAHIHIGFDDIAGPVVVPLAAPTSGSSAGCVDVPREKIHAMLVAPWAFYVNVHNADFPGGAIRGQLG